MEYFDVSPSFIACWVVLGAIIYFFTYSLQPPIFAIDLNLGVLSPRLALKDLKKTDF